MLSIVGVYCSLHILYICLVLSLFSNSAFVCFQSVSLSVSILLYLCHFVFLSLVYGHFSLFLTVIRFYQRIKESKQKSKQKAMNFLRQKGIKIAKKRYNGEFCILTVCPRSSDPFYIVTYYIKWVTTSWTGGSRSINFHISIHFWF